LERRDSNKDDNDNDDDLKNGEIKGETYPLKDFKSTSTFDPFLKEKYTQYNDDIKFENNKR
jgi:hypothetical protein